jgi:hypothetical protein
MMWIGDHEDDVQAIRAVIARQLASLSWAAGEPGDWAGFAADFLPDATLFPAARPATSQTVPDFIARMQRLSESSLTSFKEALLGSEIHVFGKVAVAVAVCEMTENERETNRSVEMMLLVKNDSDGPECSWRIVAQAWDKASDANLIPTYLLSKNGAT